MGENGTKIIKLFLRQLFLILSLQYAFTGIQAQPKEVRQAERKYERLLEQEKRNYARQREATIRHRYEIQSPDVKARMKETEKRSQKYGRKNKDPWCKNIFDKKKKRTQRIKKPR